MANMRFATFPSAYNFLTSGAALSGSWSAAFPSAMVRDLTRPRRPARSTNTSASSIVCDLGAPITVSAFSVENVNFQNLFIEGSDDQVTWGFKESFVVTGTDSDDGRRKAICIPSTTFTKRYVRISSSGGAVPANGDAFFQIGAFGVWPFLVTLTKNFSTPYEKSIDDKAEEMDFLGGGLEVNSVQPVTIQFNLQARVPRANTTAANEFRSMATYPRDKVMLLYENEGDITKMYHVRRDASFRITRTENATFSFSGIQFSEVR